jgi:hypothetical protein
MVQHLLTELSCLNSVLIQGVAHRKITMTINTLFIILIRTISLFVLVQSVAAIVPMMLATAMFEPNLYTKVGQLSYSGAQLIVVLILGYLLISRAPWIARTLRFNKGLDQEQIVFHKIESLQMARVGVFLVGIILIVLNLNDFIVDLWQYFKSQVSNHDMWPSQVQNFWVYGLNLFLGALMVGSSESIAKRLVKKPLTEEDNSPLDSV